jgi:uncharacterized lipoprotein YmbA
MVRRVYQCMCRGGVYPLPRVASTLVVATAVLLSGCALTSKADPIVLLYYSPLSAALESSEAATPATGSARQELRLRRVTAAAHLREGLVHRESSSEYRVSERHLWTEPPADYLRRAITRQLFERQGVRRAFQGSSPTLELELTCFEELRDQSKVRVEVVASLQVGQRAVLQETFRVEGPAKRPSDSSSRAAVAEALGKALAEVVVAIAAKVTERP